MQLKAHFPSASPGADLLLLFEIIYCYFCTLQERVLVAPASSPVAIARELEQQNHGPPLHRLDAPGEAIRAMHLYSASPGKASAVVDCMVGVGGEASMRLCAELDKYSFGDLLAPSPGCSLVLRRAYRTRFLGSALRS